MDIRIFTPDGGSTVTRLVNGQPELAGLAGLPRDIRQNAFNAGNWEEIPVPIIAELDPDPMGFRNKLYGLSGANNNALFGVYMASTLMATNPATASAALTESRNILEGSFWNEPFSKIAFAAAFGMLQDFLTAEQIAIFEENIVEFNLT